MYKLINIRDKNKIPYHTSNDLVALWQKLDNKEYKYKEIVIINDKKEIVAGKESAWRVSKNNNFKV
jgi:hypothetical protein